MILSQIGEWDPYWSREESLGLMSTESLRKQLLEAKEEVFEECETDVNVIDLHDTVYDKSAITTKLALEQVFQQSKNAQPRVRIISIHSERTISPLKITSEVAAQLFLCYQVKPEFLRLLLSFGNEPHESEASSGSEAFYSSGDGNYVLFYKLNYVEQNRRPGRSPWSFRHVAVYHHHQQDLDLLILVHCTRATTLVSELDQMFPDDFPDSPIRPPMRWQALRENPLHMHGLVLSSYLNNWRPYLRYLGERFSQTNDETMVAGAEKAGEDSFHRVKELRNTSDFGMFALSCCSGNLDILQALESAKIFSDRDVYAFQSMSNDIHRHIESAKVLQQRIRNATDLAGYTLSLHYQQEIRNLTEQTRNLAEDTGAVTKKLKELTQNTVDDSAIVNIIAVVSAVYLPGSFAGTIFGMNFFDFDSRSRKIVMTRDFWIFVVIWLSLTALTAAVFLFIYWRKRGRRHLQNLP